MDLYAQRHEYHLGNHPGLARSMLSSLRHMVYSQRQLAFKAVGSHPRPLAVSWGPLDNVTPIEDAPELLALMPNAKLTTHAGTGHWVRRRCCASGPQVLCCPVSVTCGVEGSWCS